MPLIRNDLSMDNAALEAGDEVHDSLAAGVLTDTLGHAIADNKDTNFDHINRVPPGPSQGATGHP